MLHWLPIVYQIKFKLATVKYSTIPTQQPTYLVNMLKFLLISLGPLDHPFPKLFIPKTKLNIGKRAFSVAAPTIWNKLPIVIKSSETTGTISKKIKTYLFEIAFPP